MLKSFKMRKAAQEVRTEYLHALSNTQEREIDMEIVRDEFFVIQGVKKNKDKRFQSIGELRSYLGLCFLGRGHWLHHCEQVNCEFELEQQEQRQ